MKRKMIKIDEEKCNGCGLCIPNCPEGALQMIDGKARLISDLFCDGLGACIGNCPEGAITFEEREAEPYDEKKVMENITKQGKNVIKAHLKHLKEHNEEGYLKEAVEYLKEKGIDISPEEDKVDERTIHQGCPGSRILDSRAKASGAVLDDDAPVGSELRQWPVQLQLVNPHASYFKDADLVIAADCVSFAYGDFHKKFLRGKTLIIFCPKLDTVLDEYIEKLAVIFKDNNIKSITLLHMEVPCCHGLVSIAEEALKRSGKNIIIKDYTISLDGNII